MTTLKLAVPSKGRLQADTIDWFARHDINIRPAEGGREYTGQVDGVDNVELVLLSAGEIPRELKAGRIHLGLTGRDMVRERISGWDDMVREIAVPGFGFADLVIAVPAFWTDVEDLDDLDSAAAAFRETHGFRLRIATKYHVLVREFLQAHDVADYQLVDSQGATEGTIRNLTAEAIADITTTGETLRANHLKILKNALVLKSEAVLFEAASAEWSDTATAARDQIVSKLGAA